MDSVESTELKHLDFREDTKRISDGLWSVNSTDHNIKEAVGKKKQNRNLRFALPSVLRNAQNSQDRLVSKKQVYFLF